MTATADVTVRYVRTVMSSLGASEETEIKKTLENARVHKADFAVVASAEATLWDTSVTPCPLGSFDFLELVSDIEVEVEFETGATARTWTVTLAAGKPYHLWSDASREGTTGLGDAFGGTASDIAKIKVLESNAVAGELSLFMAKT